MDGTSKDNLCTGEIRQLIDFINESLKHLMNELSETETYGGGNYYGASANDTSQSSLPGPLGNTKKPRS